MSAQRDELHVRAPLRSEAVVLAVRFYDHARADHSEHSARRIAALYLCRKVPAIDANTASELLADALAIRAHGRITSAQAAILQGV